VRIHFLILLALFSLFAPDASARGRLESILQEAQLAAECRASLESLAPRRDSEPDPSLSLQTDRFRLRPLSYSDLDQVFPIFSDPRVQDMSGDHLGRGSLAQLLMAGTQNPGERLGAGEIINFGIFEGEKLIGMTQIAVTTPLAALEKGIAKPGETWVEVSYHLNPDYWGRGIAPEVALKTTELAFSKYNADGIHGQTIPSNEASGKVLKKLGMELVHSDAEFNVYAARRETALANRKTSPKTPGPPPGVGTPRAPPAVGSAPAPKTSLDLKFKAELIVEPRTLEIIRAARAAPDSEALITILARIGSALEKDPRFSEALANSAVEHQRENWDTLMGNLLNLSTPDEALVQVIAEAKLDFLRDYFTGHHGAMNKMAEILESDARVAAREKDLSQVGKDNLVVRLIVNRDVPVRKIIDQYLAETAAP
jgi:RimJ/RimL family protein N-acetyltransferase